MPCFSNGGLSIIIHDTQPIAEHNFHLTPAVPVFKTVYVDYGFFTMKLQLVMTDHDLTTVIRFL